MGRNRERPDGYDPPLQLLLRERPEGGTVRVPGGFRDPAVAARRQRCLVMVHGFNNNDGEAAHAYNEFRKRQSVFFGASIADLNETLADTFWPGDADWGWFDLVDFGVYSGAVGNAHRTANALVALLGRMPSLLEVDFIGHSLGCRVILETLHHLQAAGSGPAVRRVCLMAAAVPMEKIEPGGEFHDTLARLAVSGTRVLVLHSRQDRVLQFAFPAGQATAGPGERSSRALGREGPNPLLPGYRATLDEMQMGGADHGDYWGHSSQGEAARQAGRFFGFGASRSREAGAPRRAGVDARGYPRRRSYSSG